MEKFIKKSVLSDSWIPITTKFLTEKYRVLLYDKNKKVVYCPNHCRWELVSSLSDFNVETEYGEKFDGFVVNYEVGYCFHKFKINEKENADIRLPEQLEIFGLFSNEKENAVYLSIYFLKMEEIVDKIQRGYQLCGLNFHLFCAKYDFDKGKTINSEFVPKIPEEIKGDFNKELQKKVSSCLAKKINFPYEIDVEKNYQAYFQTPYELNIYPLKKCFEKLNWIDRRDPNIYGKVLDFFGVKGNPTLRKAFYKNPFAIIRCKIMVDWGFKDMNIISLALGKDGDLFFTSEDFEKEAEVYENHGYYDYKSMNFYIEKAFEKKSEKAVWNSMKKDFSLPIRDKIDLCCMFQNHYDHIPEEMKKDMIKNGLTKYNHDVLSNFSREYENAALKKILAKKYKYSKKQLSLEDEIDGVSFLLPKNGIELNEIGAELHNCVGSYNSNILEGRTTVVYGKKQNDYVFCIEVRQDTVFQFRGDRNSEPSKKYFEIFEKWCNKHELIKW